MVRDDIPDSGKFDDNQSILHKKTKWSIISKIPKEKYHFLRIPLDSYVFLTRARSAFLEKKSALAKEREKPNLNK